MHKHIRPKGPMGVTRQRADFAGSLRDRADLRQGGVAKALRYAQRPNGHRGGFRSYPWRKSAPAKWIIYSRTGPYGHDRVEARNDLIRILLGYVPGIIHARWAILRK